MLTQAWERCRCCLLHVGSLGSVPYLCMLLPSLDILPFICPDSVSDPPLQISAWPCSESISLQGNKNKDKVFLRWGLCSLRVALCGLSLKCAEMLSWSKTLFINLLSALKLFKSQGLLHNPTFWSWECGKVLPRFFIGFSLILNFDSFPILMCCLWLFLTTV